MTKLLAVLTIALGLLGQLAAFYFFAIRSDELRMLPLIITISLFSAVEVAGVLALVRRRGA